MGWYSHDGAGAIAGKHVVAHPDGDAVAGKRVCGVCSGENARHLAVGDALTLGALLCRCYIVVHGLLLTGCCDLGHVVALGCQHHKCNTKHGVGAGGEYREFDVAVLDGEFHFCSLGTANPVALGVFQRVGPVNGVQTVEQSL